MTDIATQLIEAAANAAADATLAVNEADAALEPAVAGRDRIADRIRSLETERTSILEARRGGHHDDAIHGARLLLIAADLDDLNVMRTEADVQIAPLRQAAEEARRRLAAAVAAQDAVREDEILRQTMTRATELGELLLQAVAAIELHKVRLTTQRDLWTPSRALAEKLQALWVRRVQEVSKC